MVKNKKKMKGLFTLILGALLLVGSLLINHYIDVDDTLCVVLMTLSLMVEVYGLFQIIKDTYN